MIDTSSNFAQPCCEIEDFQAIIYSPDSKIIMSIGQDTLFNYECRTTPRLGCDAILTIEDSNNLKDTLSANTNLWVHIFYVEHDDTRFTRRDFRVLNTQKLSSQNKAMITFELQDTVSYIFGKTFKAGKFKGLGKCLESYYDEFVFSDKTWKEPSGTLPGGLKGFRCDIAIQDFSDDTDEVVIPANLNFLEAFNKELRRKGCICFLENNVLYIYPLKKLKPQNLPSSDIVYSRKSQDEANSDNYLYYSKFIEAPKDTQKPKTQAIAYDFETKKMNLQNTGIDLDIDIEEFENSGVKLEYTENLNDSELFLKKYLSYLDTYTGRLVIPTRGNMIQLFTKIRIEAHNPKAGELGDIRESGYFIITGYVDKIMLKTKLVSLVKVSRFS